MWAFFFLCCLLLIAMLYVPGYLTLRVLSQGGASAICFAPAISIFMLSGVELALVQLGVRCTVFSVGAGVASVILLLLCLIHIGGIRAADGSSDLSSSDFTLTSKTNSSWLLFLYLIVGLIAVFLYIVLPLDGPASFFQGWDNLHHLGDAQNYVNSGVWSPLFSSRYGIDDVSPTPYSPSFYPSAWHVLSASAASTFGVSVPVAVNALNTVLVGVVFSTSAFMLIKTVFPSSRIALIVGSLLSMAIPACPWDYLIYGPLFPNLMSMTLVPLGMSAFIQLCRSLSASDFRRVAISSVCLVTSVVSVALAHPNGVFTLILLLSPYLSCWIAGEQRNRNVGKGFRLFSQLLLWTLIAVFWLVCRKLSMFSGVTSVAWPAITGIFGALRDVVLLGFFNHPIQPLVSAFLLLGICCAFKDADKRWIAVSYIFAAVVYVVDAATDGEIKQILAGYWYTDYHRTAAIVGLMAIVLSVYGVSSLVSWLTKRVGRAQGKHLKNTHFSWGNMSVVLAYAVGAFLLFMGNLSLFGVEIKTPFGYQGQEFKNQYDYEMVYYDVLTAREQEFCEKALSLIPEGSLVINNPSDGSVFMYPLFNANLYYRGCYPPSSDSETPESSAIRFHLDALASDAEVADAVESLNAEYVIQLDHGERHDEFRIRYANYAPGDWLGIDSIEEDTPGFELILKDRDMRLYRIVG